MKDQTIYAVVDIETTGTSTTNDKIIQFACVLVQDRKIINHFSSDINPLQTIPKNIEALTGISNEQVANAPYFEDIAPIITDLLNECVFVAHNVFFDFAFLNSELVRAGESELRSDCVDTVELSQILFPKSPGFRVADLADYFDLAHENPHQALSDAYVTAEIFIELIKKLDHIPYITLKKMTELSIHLGVDNSQIFEKALLRKEQHELNQLLDNVKTIDMISLRRKNHRFKEKTVKKLKNYPKTDDAKKELIDETFTYRKQQGVMMDEIYDFITENKEEKNLLVEASTGTGKTLGYLTPLIYLSKEPIIVSTSTIMLQEQLMDSSLPQLEKLTKESVNGVIVKSSRHFVDLEKFYKTLLVEPNHQKQYIINQMAVLNWLRETETGDLDELNLNKNHLFFEHIEHRGLHTLNESSLFYEEDFLRLLESKKKYADVIIVNHAFLCEETYREHSLLPKSNYLVIDEAHKLIHTLEEKNLKRISFRQMYSLLRKIKDSDDLLHSISTLEAEKLRKIILLLTELSLDGRDNLQWLEKFLVDQSGLTEKQTEKAFEDILDIPEWPLSMKKNLKELLTIFREMNQLIAELLTESIEKLKLVDDEQYFYISDYLAVLKRFKEVTEAFIEFFRAEDSLTRLLSLEKNTLLLKQIDFKKVSIEETSWYPNFKKIIFTSGTLQLNVKSDYFETQLGLPNPKKILLPESFPYEENAKLVVLTDYEHQDYSNSNQFASYIVEAIISTHQLKGSSMLVLFTSHHLLNLVYQQLNNKLAQENIEILAQGITGTKEKIAKRFTKAEGGIILGANSFWEGIDFSLPHLDIIMMTKLPFDPPKRPLIEAKYHYLEKQGKNPFYDEAIPQAGSRLRQGLGRLIRTEDDYGVVLMLDSRLTKSSYSDILLNYLPQKLKVEEYSLENALPEILTFFTEKKLKSCYNDKNETKEN